MEIRLGYFPNITHAQALYARATGYYETNAALRIKWVSFNAGPTAIEAVFSDAIDATYVGPNPAITGFLRSHGEKFAIVAGSASGGAALVVRADSGVKSERDFAGRTIATPQLGNTQDVAARVWLREKGYRLRDRGGDVNLIPLSNADQLTMFKKKQLDAAWTIEPWVSRLELEVGGKVLLEEKELWPDGKYVTTHLVVSRSFLAKAADTIVELLRAHVEITQLILSNKPAAIKVLNSQLKNETSKSLKDVVIQQAMDRVELTWDPLPSTLYRAAEAAHKIHFIRSKPDLNGIYELHFLNQVLREKNLPPIEDPRE